MAWVPILGNRQRFLLVDIKHIINNNKLKYEYNYYLHMN